MKVGKLSFNVTRPAIMGVVNVTTDSFSDGGQFLDSGDAIRHALQLANSGADIIDVGGESTRPGSASVDLDDELGRVIPVIEGIRAKSSVPISIDTTKSGVASAAIGAGADIVNDISAGLFDPQILDVVAESGVGLSLMHMKGTPENMQIDPTYGDLIGEISTFLVDASKRALACGVGPESIILDPGVGFGKSAGDNVLLLKELQSFVDLGFPILIGTSKKSFMGKLLGYEVNERLEGTLATLAVAMDGGASIVRVHDVLEAKRFMDTYSLFR
jgi:dihydropteroate synthase